MTLTKLCYLIISLNSAIDSEKYRDIGLDEVKKKIEEEEIFDWLEAKLGADIDLSLLNPAVRVQIARKLAEIEVGYSGQERRKWGVERQGLCLLLAWVNELVQTRSWDGGKS